jgi:hypothetical protein
VCQPKSCPTAPPTTGPTAALMPTLEATTPKAPPRFPGGSTFATATLTSADTADPAIPCKTRPKTRTARLGAKAQMRPPAANPKEPRSRVSVHHGRCACLRCHGVPDGEAVGTCLRFRAVSKDSQNSPALIRVLLAVRLVAGEPAAVGGDEIVGAFLGPPHAWKPVEVERELQAERDR